MAERTGPCDPKSTLPEREEGGARVCPTCGGAGVRPKTPDRQPVGLCPDCDGTGEVRDGDA
jgi:DnaJ-class molecular chaperone